MNKQQQSLCEIATQMHRYGCNGWNGRCHFDPYLSHEKWDDSYYTENYVFLNMAKKAVRLINENNISYNKFIRAYYRWKCNKRISRKMENLMIDYGIIKGIKKRTLWDIIRGYEEEDINEKY